MKPLVWLFFAAVLALGGCVSAGTRNDSGPKPPPDRVSCEDFSSIMKWQVRSADPIAVVGHGVMLDWQGREVAATPVFIPQTQRYYLKSLYLRATDAQRADFQKKQQRLCPETRLAPEDKTVVNAALISWLITVVKPADAVRLETNNATLINGVMVSATIRARLETEGQNR